MNIKDAYIDLACAVLNQLIKDYKRTFREINSEDPRPLENALQERMEIEDFVNSNGVDLYCDIAGVNKDFIVKKIYEIKNGEDTTTGRYTRLRGDVGK